jgi:hypothetical protein
MNMMPDHEQTSVIIELVRDAARDISAFVGKGANYRSAGTAARTNVRAAIRLLAEIEAKLSAEIDEDDARRANERLTGQTGEATTDTLRKIITERFGTNGTSHGK